MKDMSIASADLRARRGLDFECEPMRGHDDNRRVENAYRRDGETGE